ncbi:hypothetical protein [Vibrio sp. 10N.239.312.D08]|uniref:hypothetical protein n=1 Tax=Vibrio sp. 10N.239.312.D08 TaxID=3229978 RepID=UPI0035544C2F
MKLFTPILTSLALVSAFVSTNALSAYVPSSNYRGYNPYACAELRFNAYNFKLELGENVVEVYTGKDKAFALGERGSLFACPEGMKFANMDKLKCASADRKLNRKWANSIKLNRGVHYQRALALPVCDSVIMVGFNKAVYLETINTEE